jgi:hypothetical protein
MENPLNNIGENGIQPGRIAVYLLINSAFAVVLRAWTGVNVGAAGGSRGTRA